MQRPRVGHYEQPCNDSTMAIHRDKNYYFSPLITFQVEDTIFQVPRKEFVEQSEVFANMFAMPSGEDAEEDGRSDEHPLRLEGVSADDFRAFLKALYPSYELCRPALFRDEPLTDAELEVALHLAKMWCFDEFRKVLIENLDSPNLTPSRMLQLARTHDIRQWYKPKLKLLALRQSGLTLDEGKQLGSDLAVIVSILRDERYNGIVEYSYPNPTNQKYVSGRDIEANSRGRAGNLIDKKLAEFSQSHHWDD